MKALFFIWITAFLIIIQTIVLPSFSIYIHSIDLLIIDIIFLSLIATRHWMVLSHIAIGAIMDSISGVPFFYHIFSYLWIYVLVHLMKQLLFKRSMFFIVILSAASVLIQQAILLFCLFVQYYAQILASIDYNLFCRQVILGCVVIPLGVRTMQGLYDFWNKTVIYLQKQIAKQLEWYSD